MPTQTNNISTVLNTVQATHADVTVVAKTYVTQITFTGNSTIVNPVWLDPVVPYTYTAYSAGVAQVSTETLSGSVAGQPYTLIIYKYPGLTTPNTVVSPQYDTETYVAASDSDTDLAAAFVVEINKNNQSFVMATSSSGVITLTAINSTASFTVIEQSNTIGAFTTTTANVPAFGAVNSNGSGLVGLPNVYISGLVAGNTYDVYTLTFYSPTGFGAFNEGVALIETNYYICALSTSANVAALTTYMNASF